MRTDSEPVGCRPRASSAISFKGKEQLWLFKRYRRQDKGEGCPCHLWHPPALCCLDLAGPDHRVAGTPTCLAAALRHQYDQHHLLHHKQGRAAHKRPKQLVAAQEGTRRVAWCVA